MTVNMNGTEVTVEPGDIVRLTCRYDDRLLPKFLRHCRAEVLRVSGKAIIVKVFADATERTLFARHIRDVSKKVVK